VSKSAIGLVKAGLSATWSCEDSRQGCATEDDPHGRRRSSPPAAGAMSVGGGCRVIFTETVLARQVAVKDHRRVLWSPAGGDRETDELSVAVTLAGTEAAGELLARVMTLPRGAFPVEQQRAEPHRSRLR